MKAILTNEETNDVKEVQPEKRIRIRAQGLGKSSSEALYNRQAKRILFLEKKLTATLRLVKKTLDELYKV